VGVFAHASVSEAVLELLEKKLEVARTVKPVLSGQTARPVRMHPLEVNGIDGVLLALEPVARHFRENDLHETVPPVKRLPIRQERRWFGPKIGPEQAGQRP